MNYCIKAADVMECSKIQMGILPARKKKYLSAAVPKADNQKGGEVLLHMRIAFKKKESDIFL